jgi:Dyp-type peroxidase family
MQGLVLSSYPLLDRAAYLLLRIEDAAKARAWLRHIRSSVTPALRMPHREPTQNLNIAFTYAGLAKLLPAGTCSDAEFERPFYEGMGGSEHRRRILGDEGVEWYWGGGGKPVDILLMAYGLVEQSLQSALERWRPETGLSVIEQIEATSLAEMGGREHFGFADAVSQPILTGSRDAERYPESLHLTELGEIVLGYRNADGETTNVPPGGDASSFGQNGSYLVVRQLRQNVTAFEAFLDAQGGHDALVREHLAAKIIGRGRDGTPLVPYTNRDDNEFGFADDPYGYGCPLGAHMRRANPRDSFVDTNAPAPTALSMNRHRIVRRGRAYGSRWSTTSRDEERGLVFICLNAGIERQFEFVQGDWINNTGFLGLSRERDPLIGCGNGYSRFTIQAIPAPAVVSGLEPFVTVRGGEYFFLPGLRALGRIAGESEGGAHV